MFLAIERSSAVASAALYSETRELLVSVRDPVRGQGDAFPLVRRALDAGGATPLELTGFAVGVGPGSFSGVRAALALARGLAAAEGLPVVGVNTAAAMARRYRAAHPDAAPIRVLGDARRGHLWLFEEPSDYKTLHHTAQDIRLLDRATFVSESGVVYLLADPARLEGLVAGTVPAEVFAEDIAALAFEGCTGPADPVYLHPAVVGTVTSEV